MYLLYISVVFITFSCYIRVDIHVHNYCIPTLTLNCTMEGNKDSVAMLPKTVLYRKDQLDFMKELKKTQGVTPSDFIRIAVDERIDKLKAREEAGR